MSDEEGEFTLHGCVERGDLDKLTRLLNKGCPVDKVNWRRQTPLCIGAKSGHTEIIKVLISHGADVNVIDDYRRTPLHHSAWSGHTEIVKLLIQHGADIDAVNRWGKTPLRWAESCGHIDTAYILRHAKPIQAVQRKFLSSSHDISTYSSRSAKVKCSTNVTDREGKLTLHECVRRKDLEKLTRLLNDECPVDGRDEDGWTPLYIGAWLGHTEIVKVLISRGADVNVGDMYGWTPLDYMAYQGNREIVAVLISHGADVNIKGTYGDTPLLKSVCEGQKEIVEVLLKNRADVNVKDNAGQTPLHNSAWSGHKEILDLLIQHRADVNVKDICGQTPLHYSARLGHTEIVNLLIQHRADVNVKNFVKKTPLHYSAWLGHTEIVNLLIRHRADVNVKNFDGLTPLHRSAESGHTEIVKLLIQHGADIDAVDNWGDTPLMYAKKNGHSDIVDIIKELKYPGRKIKKAFAGFFGYSSRTRKVTVRRTDDKGQITKVKYESSEVRNVTESLETFESVGEGEEDKVNEQNNSQDHIFQETIEDEVARCAQELMKAVKRKKQSGKDDGEVGEGQNFLNVPCDHCGGNAIVIKEKTVNNTYHNHYHNCDSTNKQTTCEEIKTDTLKSLDIGVGSTRYGLLHLSRGDDHEKEDEEEYNYKTEEDRETGEEGRDKHSLDVDKMAKTFAQSSSPTTTTTSPSSAPSSTTTYTSATELRRRLESQARYMEKMVQSCVAGGGVCQDQSSDLVSLLHGAYVPVNFNFIMQPKHVEVWSARQMNVEKAEVETAEMMAVNSPCTFNYAAKKSSDDEDNEDNTDDDNSEDDKEIQIEHCEDVSDGDQ